jgi:protein-serine/threonine kinase
MHSSSIPWRYAKVTDSRFKLFIESPKFAPFERLIPPFRQLLYRILDPNPATRITMKDLLENEWVSSTCYCSENSKHSHHTHDHH